MTNIDDTGTVATELSDLNKVFSLGLRFGRSVRPSGMLPAVPRNAHEHDAKDADEERARNGHDDVSRELGTR